MQECLLRQLLGRKQRRQRAKKIKVSGLGLGLGGCRVYGVELEGFWPGWGILGCRAKDLLLRNTKTAAII